MEKKKNEKIIGKVISILAILSIALFLIEKLLFLFVKRTDFSDRMVSMAAMLFLTVCGVMICRKLRIELSVFPDRFSGKYVAVSILVFLLLVMTPSNFTGRIGPILLLLYSSIAVSVFEELIFRGYVWNQLNRVFDREWKTYITTTCLFALWHLGYIYSIAFRIQEGLPEAMMWKVITGFCFGVILGLVRMKTKNCYSTILLHGVMNVFGR